MAEYITLISIALSAAFASIAYIYQSKQSKLKVLRQTLYLLLELRYRIIQTTIKPEDATDAYLKKVKKLLTDKGVQGLTDESIQILKEPIFTHINNIISTAGLKVDEPLTDSLQLTLEELSKYAPELAYWLQGQQVIDGLLNETYKYKESTKEQHSKAYSDEKDLQFLEKSLTISTEQAEKDLVKSIEHLITGVSKRCGVLSYFRTKRVMKNTLTLDNRYNFDGIENYVNNVIKQLDSSNSIKESS